MIIAFCGFIGSGKDTAADYLVNKYDFRRESFAGALKDVVSSVFGWDRELLEGRTAEARAWREQIDPWWANRLNMPSLTPRWVLQYWGTEVCRIGFHDDIWIASLENRIRKSADNIVISDVRFPNEINAIHSLNGYIIRVKRGPDPVWYEDAVIANQGPDNNPKWTTSVERIRQLGIHASETAWAGKEIDLTIENNSSIDALFNKIENVLIDLGLNLPASMKLFG